MRKPSHDAFSAPTAHQRLSGRLARLALAGVLALGCAPVAAFADTAEGDDIVDSMIADAAQRWERALSEGDASAMIDRNAYNSTDEATASLLASEEDSLPASLDLREKGVVTPVKFQNPWNTCWGFSAVAAAETSILSELGVTYDQVPLDLSELHLAWFSQTALPDDGSSQAGEGSYAVNSDPNQRLNTGGATYTATSIFSSGIGPLLEEQVPYRNAEGIVTKTSDGTPVYYSTEGDWSVSEDLRFDQVFEFEGSNALPSPAGTDESGSYVYQEEGTAAIKKELSEGRAVQIAYRADMSKPGEVSDGQFINTETWAQYSNEVQAPDHAVTIVGWDDNYSASNFLEGKQPPADGAWIVKNSWGSVSEEFPNWNPTGWGVNGEGYFYLSYYDETIALPETLDFDTTRINVDYDHYYMNAYDFMPAQSKYSKDTDYETAMANVFTAEADQLVRTVSSETMVPNTTVTYDVYLLDEGAATPVEGKLVAQATETYEFGGHHRFDLDTPVPVREGQRFSVVVTHRNPDGTYRVSTDASPNEEAYERLTAMGLPMVAYGKAVINKGESYMMEEGEWTDFADSVAEVHATEDGKCIDFDNFAIKAYSDPIELPDIDYADVSYDDWFVGAVDYVSSRGIMEGYGNGYFGADDYMTTEQVACMLFKYLAPEEAQKYADPAAYSLVQNATPLTDVESGQYYTPAVNWAYENEYIYGNDGKTLGVGQPINRERFAVILHRLTGSPVGKASIDSFPDAQDVSPWATDSVAWCIENGIIEGSNGSILPHANALRAEVAKMIMVYDQLDSQA